MEPAPGRSVPPGVDALPCSHSQLLTDDALLCASWHVECVRLSDNAVVNGGYKIEP